MNKICTVLLLTCTAAFSTVAQPTDPPGSNEFFAGYSLLKADYTPELPNPPVPVIGAFEPKQTLHGLNVAYTRYLAGGFGLTGDFSAHFKTNTTPDPLGGVIENKISIYNFLGGPHYKFFRNRRVSPFVRALAGVGHTNAKLTVSSINASDNASSTDFALAVGGGVDVRLNDHFDIRVIQADYNPIFLRRNNQLGFGQTRADNFRFSFGVVFR